MSQITQNSQWYLVSTDRNNDNIQAVANRLTNTNIGANLNDKYFAWNETTNNYTELNVSNRDSLEKNRGYWIYVDSLYNTQTGVVIDSYGRNMEIFQDTNNDGTRTTQPYATSNADGTFIFPAYTDASIPWIARGGTDIATNKAPIQLGGFVDTTGATTIFNAFTTMAANSTSLAGTSTQIQQDYNAKLQNVADAYNIAVSVISGDFVQAQNKDAELASLQITNAVKNISDGAANSSISEEDVIKALSQEIVTTGNAGQQIDLSDNTTVNNIITQTETSTGVALPATVKSNLVEFSALTSASIQAVDSTQSFDNMAEDAIQLVLASQTSVDTIVSSNGFSDNTFDATGVVSANVTLAPTLDVGIIQQPQLDSNGDPIVSKKVSRTVTRQMTSEDILKNELLVQQNKYENLVRKLQLQIENLSEQMKSIDIAKEIKVLKEEIQNSNVITERTRPTRSDVQPARPESEPKKPEPKKPEPKKPEPKKPEPKKPEPKKPVHEPKNVKLDEIESQPEPEPEFMVEELTFTVNEKTGNVRLSVPAELSDLYMFETTLHFDNVTDADSHNLSKWVKKDSNWRYVKNKHSDNLFTLIFRPNEGEIKTLNQIRFEQLLNKQRPLPKNDTIIFKNFPKLLTNITNVVVKLTDTCPDKSNGNAKPNMLLTNIYKFDFNTESESGYKTVWEYDNDYKNILFETQYNGQLDNYGNPLQDVILRLPKHLENQFLFELHVKFENMNDESSNMLQDWLDIPMTNDPQYNWEHSLEENKGYFTLAFRKTKFDILYFKQITLEQRINQQKKYKNDRVILRNWPVNLPEIVDVVLKLTPQGQDIEEDLDWNGVETVVTEYSFNSKKPTVMWV